MKTKIKFKTISFLICTILTACGSSPTQPEVTSNQQAVMDTATPTVVAPTATPTPSPIPAATVAPMATIASTSTPTPIPSNTLTPTREPLPAELYLTGKFQVLTTATDFAGDIAISPDAKILAMGDVKGKILLWDIEKNTAIGQKLTGHTDMIRRLCFSPDGHWLVSGSSDKKVIAWSLPEGKQVFKLEGHVETIASLAISPDSLLAASGDVMGLMILWDLATGKEVARFENKTIPKWILGLKFSLDGKLLYIGTGESYPGDAIKIYDITQRQVIGGLKVPSSEFYYNLGISLSNDGSRIVGGTLNGLVIWDVKTQIPTSISRPIDSYVFDFSPDDRLFAFTNESTIFIYDATTLQEVAKLDNPPTEFAFFLPDGRLLAWSYKNEIDKFNGTAQIGMWTLKASTRPTPTQSPTPTATIPTPTSSAFGKVTAPGVIVFSEGNDISIIKPDGTSQTRLINTEDDEFSPVGSPDGKWIAFVRNPKGEELYEGADIWVMHPDGSGAVDLTNVFGGEYDIRWSPDSSQIAYDCETWRYDVCLINVDGSGQKQLTSNENASYRITLNGLTHARQFSPDGKTVVFVEGLDGVWAIAKMNTDGSGYARLTKDLHSFDPTWSPDGKKIAFLRVSKNDCEEDCTIDIYLMNPDGNRLENLTNHPSQNFGLVWSPDGSKLIFVSNRDGNNELYLLDLGTRQLTRLTNDPGDDDQPTWSPDGQWLAFTSNRRGNYDIYIIDASGKQVFQLTHDLADETAPNWMP